MVRRSASEDSCQIGNRWISSTLWPWPCFRLSSILWENTGRPGNQSDERLFVLIRGGLNEQMSKASTERQEVLEGSADDGFDAEEA
jgi:hypothetical protein